VFSPDSFKAASFAPASWAGVGSAVTPGELSGSASVTITATGALTAAGACSAWSGQWQGQWQGEWGGCIKSGAPGSMVGLAFISIAATGALTPGSIVDTILSGGGGGARGPSADRLRAANEHEQRIKRQNELVLAIVMTAVTEGCL